MSLYVRHLLFSLLCPWFMKPHPMSWCLEAVDRSAQTEGRVRSEPQKWVGRVWGHHTLSAHQVVWPCYTLLHLVTPCYTLLHLVTPRHTLSHLVKLCHALSYPVTTFYTFSYLVTPCHTSLHLFTPFQSCHTLSKHLSHPWTVNCAMMTEPTHKLADQNKTSVSQIQKQLKMSLKLTLLICLT